MVLLLEIVRAVEKEWAANNERDGALGFKAVSG